MADPQDNQYGEAQDPQPAPAASLPAVTPASATPSAPDATGGAQHPAHPVIKGLLDMIASGMQSYGKGVEDPRMAVERERTAAQIAATRAQQAETHEWHQQSVGERGRHDVATETQGQEKIGQSGQRIQTGAIEHGIQFDADGKPTPIGIGDPNMTPAMKQGILNSIQKHDLGESMIGLQQARKALTEAQTARIPEDIAMKRQALDIQTQRLAESLASLGLRQKSDWRQDQEFMMNYRPDLLPDSVRSQYSPTDVSGQPVGFRSPLKPGTASISAAQRASNVVAQLPRLTTEVKQMSDTIGPEAGRWNRFWQGEVGAADPQFAHLRDDMEYISSAIALAHAYGRLPATISDKFDAMYQAGKQDPKNMLAALDVANKWLPQIMKAGQTIGEKPNAQGAPATGGARRTIDLTGK